MITWDSRILSYILLPTLTVVELELLAKFLKIRFSDDKLHDFTYAHLWFSNSKFESITYGTPLLRDTSIEGTLVEIIRLLSDPTVNVTVNPGMTYKASELLKEFC
jgi:hypothetical protein